MGSEVPIALAQSFVPTSYTLLPPNETFFPGITDGNVPLFLELGREANAGPPLLNFENFQEAKLEVPNVQRLSDSEIPFLYKRWIAVDNQLDVFGSLTDFGLNTSFNSFSPANSSNSTVYDYSIMAFGDDGTSFLRGNITLHPPYAGPGVFNPVTYPVQGINGVFEFKIVGPLICEEFV
ncbi:proteasome (macropain) activator subunit 3 (PA28 gamma [Lentinula edodes]|uniref:Proteasome ( macropain) activator subunit 3 (PA28 gamma) n=1 Tax=Lentinula edodes TaxID=5353 RepID=A0A1Q3EKW2_LENED|nr:proteasome (macropain) activator subunit 3 (PA28 gamma [Lentinula edodes]